MAPPNADLKGNLVTFCTSNGSEVQGSLLRLERGLAAFEVYGSDIVIKTSEAVQDFRVSGHEQPLYAGRAVISEVVNAGTLLVCEAKLDEKGLNLPCLNGSLESRAELRRAFETFLAGWQSFYLLKPEFKDVVADLQNLLSELRAWLDQVELDIRASPSAQRSALERQVIDELAPQAIRGIDSLIDRFELIAEQLPPELQPVHRLHFRRQLHPLILCSPFAYRAFHKPLGYAGDYEMVSMMLRPPYEGSTLFSKIINVWLLSQAPAGAHRNRVQRLEAKLKEEALRVRSSNRSGRVYNLACGPATEVEDFVRNEALADTLQFRLVDFNLETLEHAQRRLTTAKGERGRTTSFEFEKRAVQSMLKESGRSVTRPQESLYDLVYCAGLFDYLSDGVCRRLLAVLYDMLAPGGLLMVTNVTDALNRSRPFRHSLDYVLDWHLVYRTGAELRALCPAFGKEEAAVVAEESGVNVFLEVRKPRHG